MSKAQRPEGIFLACRAAIRNQLLTSLALDRDDVERWCDAWEATADLPGVARDSEYWPAGELWIKAQCAARKLPPN